MDKMLVLALEVIGALVVLLAICKFVLKVSGKTIVELVVNTLVGLGVIWLVNYLGFVNIPLNLVTGLVVGIFGIPGAIILIILAFLGII